MMFHISSLWIILSISADSVTATILPSKYKPLFRRDDWSPNGDWRAQLMCEGYTPEPWARINLPDNRYLGVSESGEIPEVEALASYPTPRSLCTGVQYGGSSIWNAGGWCDFRDGEAAHAVFANHAHTGLKPADYREILLFCMLRCQCLPYDARIQDPPSAQSVSHPAQLISLSENMPPAPYTININGPYSLQAASNPPRVSIYFRSPPHDPTGEIGEIENEDESLTISYGQRYREPICKGFLPPWDLPEPFKTFKASNPMKYNNVDKLCKAIMFGGEEEGNAGGVCASPSFGIIQGSMDEVRDYEFQMEEYLAHPSFLWMNGDLGVAVTAWCKRACTCYGSGNPFEPLPVRVQTQIGEADTLKDVFIIKGNVYASDGTTKTALTEAVMDDKIASYYSCTSAGNDEVCHYRGLGGGSTASESSSSSSAAAVAAHVPLGYHFCTIGGVERYCRDKIGPASISALRKSSYRDPIYGKPCTRSRDCAKKRSDPYRCVMNPSTVELTALGKQTYSTGLIARCLPKIALSVITGAGFLTSKSSLLDKRGLVEQGVRICRCDESIVSAACCEPFDGLVLDT